MKKIGKRLTVIEHCSNGNRFEPIWLFFNYFKNIYILKICIKFGNGKICIKI